MTDSEYKRVLGLELPTDPRWVNLAEMSLEEILTDHAFCEQKAASTCISFCIACFIVLHFISTFHFRALYLRRLQLDLIMTTIKLLSLGTIAFDPIELQGRDYHLWMFR
jgi:tRNA isopentenyl-2-thiomethyl-A-37 hydroxylase MiaE